MRLRWVVISLAAFVLVVAILAVVLRWRSKRCMGPRPAPIVVVVPQVPADNGYDNFLKAVQLSVRTGVDVPEAGTPVTAEQRDALKQNQAALAELRRGLGKECVVPPGSLLASSGPELAAFRDFARLLIIQSRIAEDEGRFPDALPPLLDGLRLGAKIEVGSSILERLDGYAIQAMILQELRRLAGAGRIGEEDLLHPLRVLASIESKAPPIEQTLEVECRQAEAAAPQLAGPGSGTVLLRADKISVALREERDAAVRLSRKPYADVLAAIESDRGPGFTLSPSKALARTLSPTYARLIANDFELRSKRRGTQLLLAVELYRLRQGKLPKSLTDLQSLGIPGVRVSIADPLIEKPYFYRPASGDYWLYSVGPDLDDDGGRQMDWRTREGDIVFHAPGR